MAVDDVGSETDRETRAMKTLRNILHFNPDPNVKGPNGNTAVHVAC